MIIDSAQFGSASAAASNLLVCSRCHKVSEDTRERCKRCYQALSYRHPNSVQHCLALLLASLVLFVPANVYPIMITDQLGDLTESTIMGGVLLFIEEGSYGVALIIFVASIIIPLLKIGILFLLCRATWINSTLSNLELMKLYRMVEFVGKWSMVDIFVVAISVGLVQLGALTSIKPGFASIAFCLMVILTIIAAARFDPRLIWDRERK